MKVGAAGESFCPTPVGISPTVQGIGIRPGYGLSPGIATTAPAPTGVYPPRSSVWGEPEERTGVWVRSPGYGLSSGIATTAPAPPGRGRRPEAGRGGGYRHIESRGGGRELLPPPHRSIPPTVQGIGIRPGYGLSPGIACTTPSWGGGCWHIESRDRGGGFLPPPRQPHPRGDIPHGPAYGENLKKELARGFILPGTAFPRVSPALPLPGERRDAGILKVETGEGVFCPTPTGVCLPRSRV